MDLLSDDSRSDSEGDVSRPISDPQLKINRRFAESFERRERYKELDKLKYLEEDDESDSDEESEDDDGEGLTSAIEVKILKTINSLRKKDPKIYDQSTTWFENETSESEEDGTDEDDQKKKKRFKDVLREQLLSTGAGSDDENALPSKKSSAITLKTRSLAYDKEQEKLRRDFLKSAQSNDESDNGSGGEDDDENILVVKKKSQDELAREEEDVKKALEEMKMLGRSESNSSGKSSKTKGVKTKSSADKTLSTNDSDEPVVDPDTFLADYIVNKKWKSSNIIYADGSDNDKVGDDDEDEEALEAAEQFESTYNFRFEELQDSDKLANVQVIGHSRSVEGSLRRADDKRKTQRELRKERKEKERRQKEAEIRRLKNLKRQELEERLKKISEVGGLEDLGLDETALEEDWDPSKHEAMMKEQFGEDYYEGDDQTFDLYNQEIDQWLLEGGEEEDEEAAYNLEGQYADDVDEVDSGKSKKKKSKKGKKEDIDTLLDKGSKSSALAANMLDELYQLDYEDIVAGIPCRFKYKEVEPEDFGLSTDDILLADDAELNKIVSLKKLSTYNNLKMSTDEIRKIKKRSKKLRRTLQDKIKETEKEAPEVAETAAIEVTGADDEGNSNEAGEGEKRKRRRRKKKGGSSGDADAADDADADASDADNSHSTASLKSSAAMTSTTATTATAATATDASEEAEGDKAGKRKRRKKRGPDTASNNHSNENSRHKNSKGLVVDEKKQRLGLYM